MVNKKVEKACYIYMDDDEWDIHSDSHVGRIETTSNHFGTTKRHVGYMVAMVDRYYA